MRLRVMVSRHSAFYSPLIATLGAGFLHREGLDAEYSILGKGQRSHELIRDGVVDVMQSAVSSNWKPQERGESPLPVHFALINRRDGFFLVSQAEPNGEFTWKSLEGKSLLADHGLQPLVMLKYALQYNGVDASTIRIIDAGSPEEMQDAFRSGAAEYGHFQAPSAGVPIVSVGASMPEVAFSTLCVSQGFVASETCAAFLKAYRGARDWVRTVDAAEVAEAEKAFFPRVELSDLAEAITRYQKIGCWDGSIEITRDLYEQALTVFESVGEIRDRAALPFQSR
ncbi:MAG: ABC transporter substrate-binding protein [Acidobacteriaceae bacterium]|nr:ABC transporter substrate-binding protein [Acidobacteriaceae bacterium]